MPKHFSMVNSPLIFEGEDYNIHDDGKYNWMVMMKCPPRNPKDEMDRDCYLPRELPIKEAHEMAKEQLEKYFWSNSSPQGIKLNKRYKLTLTDKGFKK